MAPPIVPSQTTDAVLMVRPAQFSYDAETAATNPFQRASGLSADALSAAARAEFDAAAASLRGAGVRVMVLEDTPTPRTPDAVFPNNWFSTHDDGTLTLYPMAALLRRLERRVDALKETLGACGFRISRTLDLSPHERRGIYLEGTGSLVLDRVHRLAYACRSPRTDEPLVHEWAAQHNYTPIVFDATDAAGVPLYHTNVLMWIGSRVAAIGAGSIAAADRDRVLSHLAATGRVIVELTMDQLTSFAGNALELRSTAGQPVLALSATAHAALTTAQRNTIEAHANLLPITIPTIESVGGGSVRCMIAEIFLPTAPGE